MVGDQSSNSDHCKTSILQFLQLHLLLRFGIRRIKLEVINRRLGTSQEGLSVELCLVFPRFEDTTENDKLGPPLGIGLEDGIDGVGGGNVLGVEGSKHLGKEPANGGKHGGAAIGELGSASPVSGDVVTQAEGIKLSDCGVSKEEDMSKNQEKLTLDEYSRLSPNGIHTTFPPVSVLMPGIELSSEATPREDSTLETGAGAKAAAEPARMVMAAMDFMFDLCSLRKKDEYSREYTLVLENKSMPLINNTRFHIY